MNPFSPANCIRPALTTGVAVYGWSRPNVWALALGGLAMMAEVIWWTPRFTTWAWNWPHPLDFHGRNTARVLAVGAGFLAYPINAMRLATAVLVLAWWAVGYPVKLVNTQRWQNRKQRKLAAQAEALLAREAEGGRQGLAVGACALLARAREAIRSHGVEVPEAEGAPTPAVPPAAEGVWVFDRELGVSTFELIDQGAGR